MLINESGNISREKNTLKFLININDENNFYKKINLYTTITIKKT